MILEWLDGEALDVALERETGRRWTLDEAMRLMGPVANALDLAHQRGIAHRDIKPENLFLVGALHAPDATLKILDFGVAKVMDDRAVRAALAKTGGGMRSFTPAYGAPEQFTASYGATGPWTDVYALALVMVELLSGRRALEGNEIVEVARASANRETRPTPWARGAMVSERIERVFSKALAVSPDDRFATAGEFWLALDRARLTSITQTVTELDVEEIDPGGRASAAGQTSAEPSSGASPITPVRVVVPELTAQSGITSPSGVRAQSRAGLMVAFVVTGLLAAGGGAAAVVQKSRPAGRLTSTLNGVASFANPTARFQCPGTMVRIPAGQFFMGSDAEDALPLEKPAFPVKLDTFCFDLTEVTTDAYLACSNAGKCKRPGSVARWPNITDAQRERYSPLCNASDAARGNHPINCVDWDMAGRYCEIQGHRLPTEAEWEYATRGPDGRIYPWGDEDPTPEHLNACGSECVAWGRAHDEDLAPLYKGSDGYPTTAPVGRFILGRSRFGPLDVVGNVWEWVQDWSGPYSTTEKLNPRGPTSGERRVIRGGAWNGSYKSWLRPSFRYAQDPTALSHGIGFRCAMSLPRKIAP